MGDNSLRDPSGVSLGIGIITTPVVVVVVEKHSTKTESNVLKISLIAVTKNY